MENRVNAVFLNVMVLDDEGITVDLLVHMLRDMEFADISSFGSAGPALSHLKRVGADYYDLIICDWHMRGMNGLEFLQSFRAMAPDVPFLMITGDATKENVVEAGKAGVSGFIAKPFSRRELETKVAQLLQSKLRDDFRDHEPE
ncbi:response regulator [Bowmanella dokdonensis]|uniref:Response regulator n=1 Tax=Bowmanella dokdonensis TaxID=751969 RepID=A0A939IS01_9ALTE|nr:response regulator [Bowmanella dokdonensis]